MDQEHQQPTLSVRDEPGMDLPSCLMETQSEEEFQQPGPVFKAGPEPEAPPPESVLQGVALQASKETDTCSPPLPTEDGLDAQRPCVVATIPDSIREETAVSGDPKDSCMESASSETKTGVDGKLCDTEQESKEDTSDSSSDSSSSSEDDSSSESDSDDSSSSDSEDSSSSDDNGDLKNRAGSDSDEDQPSHMLPPLRTAKELLFEDLPAVEPVSIVLEPTEELSLVGHVTSVIGQLAVIQSDMGVAALDIDTVLFREDRKAIGVIFEVFGPVSCPLYTVRFNSPSEISDFQIELRAPIFFAPRIPNVTTYVFTQKLKELKGSDASWEHDEEPPAECLDFSDDERERSVKNKKKSDKRKRKMPNTRKEGPQDDPTATQGHDQMRWSGRSGGNRFHSSEGQGFHGPRHAMNANVRPRPAFQPRGRGMPRPPYGGFPQRPGPGMDQFASPWQHGHQPRLAFNPNHFPRAAGSPDSQWQPSEWYPPQDPRGYPRQPPPPPPPPPPPGRLHPPPPPPPPPPPYNMPRPPPHPYRMPNRDRF